MNSSITFAHLSFTWPDGSVVLDDVSTAFSAGRTGLVGDNGTGKTTVLRLINAELKPMSGVIAMAGDVSYLPQNLTLTSTATVADLLGVTSKLQALRAIEAGSLDGRGFDMVGNDWDIEVRADEALRGLGVGLSVLDLERPVTKLSGGEVTLVAIAGCRLARSSITLLDEPTNNLDSTLRRQVVEMVREWSGVLIVASHDVTLLEAMDSTVELHNRTLSVYGGPYSEWVQACEAEQAAAVLTEKAAEGQVRAAVKQRAATLERTTRNLAHGKAKAMSKGIEKAARDQMRGTAEAAAGRARGAAYDKVVAARSALDEASRQVRKEELIHIDLPDPDVHASRKLLELTWPGGSLIMQGPERVALVGRTGVGKTTLIERMLGLRPVLDDGPAGRLLTDRVGYLPQRLDVLDDAADAVSNVIKHAPSSSPAQVRAQLARMLIRGDAALRPVGSLSGGERFRVCLARLLLAEPSLQLLILDEPTNNLDLASRDHLVEALRGYRGGILVVSHDDDFLKRLGVIVVAELHKSGALAVQRRN